MKYAYDFYCEGGWLHRSDSFDTYNEAVDEAEDDIDYEVSLEDARSRDDYSYEIVEVEE